MPWGIRGLSNVPDPVWDGECLRWMGTHQQGSGYGRFGKHYIHRWIWEKFNGPIPDGMTIDHVLDRGCVWPDCFRLSHLEVVTRVENGRRTRRAREQRARTHCPADHEYTDDNIYWLNEEKTKRGCKECRRLRAKAQYIAAKARVTAPSSTAIT